MKTIREEALTQLLRASIRRVSISDEAAALMLAEVDRWILADQAAQAGLVERQKSDLARISARLERLLQAFIDGDIELCLLQPANVVPRLLLAQTLKRLGKIRPEVVAEYRDKIALLEKQHPLPPPAGGIVHRLFSELYP